MFKAAVCDDSKAASEDIKKLIKIYGAKYNREFEVTVFTDPLALLEMQTAFDMYFLDVEMPGRSGLELAKELRRRFNDPIIFFITNYEHYLDEAFDIHAFRYLYKPVEQERFFKSLDKAAENIQNSANGIFLKVKDKTVRIHTDKIIFIKVEKRLRRVVTTDNEILTDDKLEDIYKMLPENKFIHSHKSYIVNLAYVTDYDNENITLKYGDTVYSVYLSRRMAPIFRKSMLLYARGAL
ncbi:MAG: response regulator transcription factor [Firmicutes bacterium]|nr:response regulator transcription factor [Bacillota bacterium]